MRLVITVLWSFAALLWVPWFALLVRLLVDSLINREFLDSIYFVPALVGISPVFHWLGPWHVQSWWVLGALTACGLVGLGWRIYWFDQDGILTRSPAVITLTIILPVLAPIIMYRDALARHSQAEVRLESDVTDARQRLEHTRLRH